MKNYEIYLPTTPPETYAEREFLNNHTALIELSERYDYSATLYFADKDVRKDLHRAHKRVVDFLDNIDSEGTCIVLPLYDVVQGDLSFYVLFRGVGFDDLDLVRSGVNGSREVYAMPKWAGISVVERYYGAVAL